MVLAALPQEPTPASETAAEAGPDLVDAVILGIVEGLTEFLPVSSTGHLIVTREFLGLGASPENNLFVVGIQIGAITAILVLYWRRLLDALRTCLQPATGTGDTRRYNLLWQIAVAAVPAVVLGLLAEDWIDSHLFSAWVVAITMLIGGLLLLLLERLIRHRTSAREDLGVMTYPVALGIGLFQCLALIPGTSRSGATIAGAMLLGMSRTAAAEFSFLVGLPILYGAAIYKLIKAGDTLDGESLPPFLVGTAISFVSAIVVVKPFVAFLRRHTFAPFAWYRILAGGILGWLCWAGYVE
ncbi:MAG: undecaprenyl-diphosphate phosphatase [bacterium]|nr:undecaprenyl-diphosphate phosphatase [bacterium]